MQEPTNLIVGTKGPMAQYIEYLKQGVFMIQRSRSSGKYVFYPRVSVPGSGETDLEWVEASKQGKVYSMTTIRRKAERGGDYNVAIVALEEGPRLMTNVENVSPDKVHIGMEVIAHIKPPQQDGGEPVLIFHPAA